MSELSLTELLWINEAAERFESAWRIGKQPRIEQFLEGLSHTLRAEALKILLEIEIELRESSSDPAVREDFEKRFPADLPIIKAAFQRED